MMAAVSTPRRCERMPATQRARSTVTRGHGVTLTYDVVGTGPAVVCIQGVGIVGHGWRPQVGPLSTRFTVITVDNRGIGGSTAGEAPLTIDAMSADVLAILDAEGIRRCHVIGHSMGGLIALQAAVSAPQRVQSLCLLCTFANGADATALSLRMLWLGLRSRIGTRAMRRGAMLEMILPSAYLHGANRAELAAAYADLFGRDLADQPPIVAAQLRAMSACRVADKLPALVGIPTLVVSGRHDPIARPALGRAIADRVPGARFVEFEDASHALPIQCADRLNALLIEHLTVAN